MNHLKTVATALKPSGVSQPYHLAFLLCLFCILSGTESRADEPTAKPASDSVPKLYGKVGKFELQPGTSMQDMTMRIPRPDMTAAKQPFALNAINQSNFGNGRFDRTDFGAQQGKVDRSVLFGSVAEAARFLSTYDIELIVDKSMSMRRRDCPGMLSRWEWCASQSQELGRQLAPYIPRGITLIPFARFYDVFENQQPQQIANLYYGTELQRGTRLGEPLAERLNRAISRRAAGAKPSIIAVITDGVPAPQYEPQMVVDVLINASKQMKRPDDVTVVFFQIGGNDPFGARYLNDLDNSLVSWGARFDFIQSVSFSHLQQVGLARALVESVQTLSSQRRR